MAEMIVGQQGKTESFLRPAKGMLQRTCACGNHTAAGGECAQCAKNRSSLQPKLAIGATNDPLEQEADRAADQAVAASMNSVIGRHPRIQRYPGNTTEGANAAAVSVDLALAIPGRPLEPALRQDMGQRFRHDFSQVRVHTGQTAEQSARDVNARAYTVGHNIVFGAAQFAPGSYEGRKLIAHELTHVVQQNAGAFGQYKQSVGDRRLPEDAEELESPHMSNIVVRGNSLDGRRTVQRAPSIADEEYVPDLGAPEHKPLPETKPEVLGRKDLDTILSRNGRLRARIEFVANELNIDPGLLAAELLAEEGASVWSGTAGTVPSEIIGLDDWFGEDEEPVEEKIIKAHPGLGLKFTDVKATGETWDTSTEKRGGKKKPRGKLDADKAVAAFGVYFKMQEKVLRGAIKGKGTALRYSPIRTLEDLTPEQRLTVLRVGLNAGVKVGLKHFMELAKGGDIERSGKTTRDPENATRSAVLHVARAIHLAQAIFGRSPGDYKPREVPMTNKEAAEIFDHPELKKLPDYIVPFNY